MKAKIRRKARPPRPFPDDLDEIVREYGSRARVIQLWRRIGGTGDEWKYFGRLSPGECELEFIARRFGGGAYRAKILGAWDPTRRQEEYLEQVRFAIASRIRQMTG